ncbi:MAG TPA: methyltransferase domain-containing protein [Terriglobales bacterium]|nr:methyltransferase domain-containing protein [Terriglobales bacterium]
MTRSLDPYGAIDRQRQPHGYVEHLEARGRTPSQTRLRRRFLSFAQLRRGQRVLEVGSGTGIVSRDAAARLGPRGQVIGVDPSRVMTLAARRLARSGGFGSRVVHTVGDGARLRFAANSFDRVLAVTVLLHVANSAAILGEMVRVARPGGIVAVQDQDFGSLTLDHPDRRLTARIMDGVVARMYPDPFSGRALFGRLVRLGLRRVRLAVDVFQDTTLEPYTHAMLRRRAENAVRLGLASPAAAGRWLTGVERLAASGQFAFTLNYYAARGVKP